MEEWTGALVVRVLWTMTLDLSIVLVVQCICGFELWSKREKNLSVIKLVRHRTASNYISRVHTYIELKGVKFM